MRVEFLRFHDRRYATIEEFQAAFDAWVAEYNTERPHQSLGHAPPIGRFQLAPTGPLALVVDPVPAPVVDPGVSAQPRRLPGVQRWVDRHGLISLAGFRYRVPIVQPIRHDRAKEHGAFATPHGAAPAPPGCAGRGGVKATPLRGRPAAEP
jgi:hypothetical protein